MKMKRFFSVSLAGLMATTSFTPAMAAELTTGGQSTAAVETSGGSGTSPVTVTAEATTFDVSVPLALPVHVDGLGIVTTATDTNILNKSFGKVKVDAVDFTAADDWALAEYGADLSNVAVGTKSIGMKIAGALSNPSLANGVYTDADGSTVGSVTDAFSVIPGVTYDRDAEGNQSLSGMSTLLLKYSATVPAQKDAIESAETAANVVFTLVWDGSGSTGDSGSTSSSVLEGDGQTFHRLAPTALTFRSTEPIDEFQEVLVNGEVVDESNYTLTEGSTIVTLSADYLQTLETGVNKVTIVSTNNDPSGEFEIIEPVQDETSGIYYNQPYGAYIEYYSENAVLFIREDNTIDAILVDSGAKETCPYIIDGSSMVVTSTDLGNLNCTISEDGASIYVADLGTTFNLADGNVAVADEDYIYLYNEELGGYEVTATDKTKSSYAAIKTGINGIPTVAISKNAFVSNANLLSVPEMPDTVTSIEEWAFYGCTSLSSAIIPDTIIDIGEWAFACCTGLRSVIIPDSVTSIGDSAFFSCENLTNITIPDSVTSLGNSTFNGCINLISVIIGDGVTSIGALTFNECSSLANITVSESNDCYTSVNGVLFNKDKTEIVRCPAGKSDESYVIPNKTEIIGMYAFRDSNLKKITIPNSVTSIGYGAFTGVDADIYFDGTMAELTPMGDTPCGLASVICSDGTVTF